MNRLLGDDSVARRALCAEPIPCSIVSVSREGDRLKVGYVPFSSKRTGGRVRYALTDPRNGPKGGVVKELWSRAMVSLERGHILDAVLYVERKGPEDTAVFVRWQESARRRI